MKIDASIEYIIFKRTDVEFSDVSPMEYCGFSAMEKVLFKCKPTKIDVLWKEEEKKWKSML